MRCSCAPSVGRRSYTSSPRRNVEMTRPLRRRPRHGVVGCLCSTGQPSAPSSPTSTSASGSHTTKSASFPGAMEPFEPRPATHAGRELHTSRGKMRCDRGKERSASRRVARENAFGGTSRGRKPNRRKYAEVCFKSPPRRRRRLPIDKSAWYVAGNKRSVDSAAYWWGIKPPYPTAPVPSRIRAEKTTTKEPKSGRKNDGVRRRGIETHPRASRGRRFAATPPSTSPEG